MSDRRNVPPAEERARGCVLLVEDDARLRSALAGGLRSNGYDVIEASSCADARRALSSSTPDVALLDLQLSDGEAFELLPLLRAAEPAVSVFIITGNGSIGKAVRAVKEGAEDFLTKPLGQQEVIRIVAEAISRRTQARSKTTLRATGERPILRDPAGTALENQIERLRSADCTVLILGETGTGKSVLARRLHRIGAQANGPFVEVNCAGLSKEFAEAELFGHERGAFTGAVETKAGLFDAAHGGTLFLDEIGDIDVQVQPKVLKVLEEKRYRRKGDVRERRADVRLIAATHRDLIEEVEKGGFRADLYYRISTVTLTIPPLRERPDDMLAIASDMVARASRPTVLSPEARERLRKHPWFGNIRELKNVIERALLLRGGDTIGAEDLQFDPVTGRGSDRRIAAASPSSSRLLALDASTATRKEVEREHIRIALDAENGRVEAAARRLGIPRSTLYLKLKTFGMVGKASGSRDIRQREVDDDDSTEESS